MTNDLYFVYYKIVIWITFFQVKQMNKPKRAKYSSTALLTFDDFFKQFHSKEVKKRITIIPAGVIPPDVYYLKKGYARTYSVSESGEELTMVIFQPGDFFPLISTITPQKLNYYIESLTEVELIPVPRQRFIEFLRSGLKENNDQILIDFALRLTARFEGVLTRMEHLVFGTAQQRLASIILILGERFGEKKASQIIIKAPLTHRDLASLVGITRETTTLILKDLSEKNYITFAKKNIVIKNLNGLERESSISGV